jgi:hypothetical protein
MQLLLDCSLLLDWLKHLIGGMAGRAEGSALLLSALPVATFTGKATELPARRQELLLHQGRNLARLLLELALSRGQERDDLRVGHLQVERQDVRLLLQRRKPFVTSGLFFLRTLCCLCVLPHFAIGP